MTAIVAVSAVERSPGSGYRRYGSAREASVRATIELASSVGFRAITVLELAVVAEIGPRTFYNHFADLPDVFFEACRQMHEELCEAVRAAYDGAGDARHEDLAATDSDDLARARADACVEAVVAFVQADPVRARVLFVEGYAGGPAVAQLRLETVRWLVRLVGGDLESRGVERRDGCGPRGAVGPVDGSSPAPGTDPRRLLAEVAVGGIGSVLYSRISAGDLDGLDGLVPSFVQTLMRARREGA